MQSLRFVFCVCCAEIVVLRGGLACGVGFAKGEQGEVLHRPSAPADWQDSLYSATIGSPALTLPLLLLLSEAFVAVGNIRQNIC